MTDADDENLKALYNFTDPDIKSFAKIAINCIVLECLDQLYILRDLIAQCDIRYSGKVILYKTLKDR